MNIYQKIAADLFLFVLSVSAVCFVWIASSEYGPFIPLFEEILIDTLFAYMGMVIGALCITAFASSDLATVNIEQHDAERTEAFAEAAEGVNMARVNITVEIGKGEPHFCKKQRLL